jgi:hypothetical protein
MTSSGKIVRGIKSTYKRHGTLNLFAALEVATGVIRGKTTTTKKRVDFQAFMDDIAGSAPKREIPLHSNFRQLAQPNRSMVRHLAKQGAQRCELSKHRRTDSGYQ